MKIFLRTVTAAALALAVVVAGATPAAGHGAGFYYTHKWPTNATIAYGLNVGFPNDVDWRGRTYDGKEKWNAIASTGEPRAYWTLNDYVNYGVWSNPCTLTSGNNTVVVFYNDLNSIGSNTLGYTTVCASGATRLRSTVTFDSTGTSWYAGSGSPAANYSDLFSVSTHEWGHALGWTGHLAEGEANVCPAWEQVIRHTMCPTVFPGYTPMRHPKTHDIHTFQAAY